MISHLVIVVVGGQSLGCISRWTSHLVVVGVITSHLVIVVLSDVVGVSDHSLVVDLKVVSQGYWPVT